MPHTLPALPYDFAALEPHIDAQTMQIHHGKHHQAYVTNLNAALDKHPELHDKSLDDLMKHIATVPEDVRTAVRNNGGGHWNRPCVRDRRWTGATRRKQKGALIPRFPTCPIRHPLS